MKIVLIGYMGAGKTTVGLALSKALEIPMLDSDACIEADAKKKISEIFQEEGEAAFRSMETAFLKGKLAQNDDFILSCGGGMPILEENRALLKQLGTVFYLKVSAREAVRRLQGDTTRPLLQTGDLKTKIEEMLRIRNPIYEACADQIIEVDGMDVDAICDKIIKKNKKKA